MVTWFRMETTLWNLHKETTGILTKGLTQDYKIFRTKEAPLPVNCLFKLGRCSVICKASTILSSKSEFALFSTENESTSLVLVLQCSHDWMCERTALFCFECSNPLFQISLRLIDVRCTWVTQAFKFINKRWSENSRRTILQREIVTDLKRRKYYIDINISGLEYLFQFLFE